MSQTVGEFANILITVWKTLFLWFVAEGTASLPLTVRLQFPTLHVQTFTLLPCRIWNKDLIGIDWDFYPLQRFAKKVTNRTEAACRIETQSENRTQHVYEKARAADSGRSLAVWEWREPRTIRASGSISPMFWAKPRPARVEKYSFHVITAQKNTWRKLKVILQNPWAPWKHDDEACSLLIGRQEMLTLDEVLATKQPQFHYLAPGRAVPFFLLHGN